MEGKLNKYKALVVDDYPDVRDMLVECLRFSDFDAEGYGEAEKLLRDVFDAGLPLENVPDLLVVDLELETTKMQGIELLNELAERNIPSEILAISGRLSGEDLVEAIKLGAAAGIAKPFDNIFGLIKRMEILAETGMKRRLYRLETSKERHGVDSNRLQRPVFLSYANEDKKLATGIIRNLEAKNIGVWYASSTIDIGDDWRRRILDGINQATVLIALITDKYLTSPFCVAELTKFYRRLEDGSEPRPVLLPVLAGLSQDGKRHPLVKSIVQDLQYLDITVRFIDALTVLLARIQRVLGEREIEALDSKAQPSGSVFTGSTQRKAAGFSG
jgi:CheY-like chemotaxis protein